MKNVKNHLNRNIIAIILIVIIGIVVVSFTSLIPISGQTPSPSVTPTPTGTLQPFVSGQPIDPSWNAPSPATVTSDQPTTTVVADVRPAVVAINVSLTSLDFFNRPITQQAEGSGWIIDSSGIIVTNNHVVEGASTITIDLNDGRVYNATAVATDPSTDLAVIKISADNLTAASVGDSAALEVGQTVIAIGNSLGLGISATQGIVSALGVSINPGTEPLYDLIQTDAAINPGNSGGPLVNLGEQVVGVNSIKIAEAGVEGMGYAISINDALPVIQELVQKGSITYPYIGVLLQTVTPAIASTFNLSVDHGALIVSVTAGGPADQAGLQQGDVIVSIDGTAVNNAVDAAGIIRSSQVGQQLQIQYMRGSDSATATVTTAESPAS